jgi:hypothetical protein
MKKLIYGILFLAVISISYSGAFVNAQSLAGVETGDCTDKIERQGDVIKVTVCNRATDFYGVFAGLSCNANSSSSCTFYNTN